MTATGPRFWPLAMIACLTAALCVAGWSALTTSAPSPSKAPSSGPSSTSSPTTSSRPDVGDRTVPAVRLTTAPPKPEPTPQAASQPVFTAAPAAVRRTATRFAEDWLGYDARHEPRQRVLERISPLVTDGLRRRLADSAQLHVPWRVLRARRERTRFTVVGVTTRSSPPSSGSPMVVTVAGLLTTHTTLATLRTPRSLRLRLVRTDDGWLVARMHRSLP